MATTIFKRDKETHGRKTLRHADPWRKVAMGLFALEYSTFILTN